MLKQCLAQTTLPAADIERARRFYVDKLRMQPDREWPGRALFFECGKGSTLVVSLSEGTSPGTFTQVGFAVDDLEAEVQDLKAQGVVFEEYDTPSTKTEAGIATGGVGKRAFFRDTEGNLLGLIEFARR